MAVQRMYRHSTRYVYAEIPSTEDPSSAPVWIAVKPAGVPAETADLNVAEWVPGETWTRGVRRARLLIGPEAPFGALTPGTYRVYGKADPDPETPFEVSPGGLVVYTDDGAVPAGPPVLATVAYTGSYDDLLDVPDDDGDGVPTTRQITAGSGLTGGGDLSADRTFSVAFGTTAGTAAQGNDSRLSDARTPTAHTHAIAEVTGLTGIVDTLNDSLDEVETAVADKATRLTVRHGHITSGNIDPVPDSAGQWLPMPGMEFPLPAADGDYCEFGFEALRTSSSAAFLAIAVRVGDSLVHYLGTGSATPPIEGDVGFYYDPTLPRTSTPRPLSVTSGLVDAGNVRFVLAYKSTGGGRVYAVPDFAFIWVAKNYGQVD